MKRKIEHKRVLNKEKHIGNDVELGNDMLSALDNPSLFSGLKTRKLIELGEKETMKKHAKLIETTEKKTK